MNVTGRLNFCYFLGLSRRWFPLALAHADNTDWTLKLPAEVGPFFMKLFVSPPTVLGRARFCVQSAACESLAGPTSSRGLLGEESVKRLEARGLFARAHSRGLFDPPDFWRGVPQAARASKQGRQAERSG